MTNQPGGQKGLAPPQTSCELPSRPRATPMDDLPPIECAGGDRGWFADTVDAAETDLCGVARGLRVRATPSTRRPTSPPRAWGCSRST